MENQQRNFNLNKQIITEYSQGESANKLSKKYNINICTIMRLLRKEQISIRTISENVNKALSLEEPNRESLIFDNSFKQMLIGLLCGDGSLRLVAKGKYPQYIHTDKNIEYIKWLKQQFENYSIKCSIVWYNKQTNCYSFQTQTLKAYEELYKMFYKNSPKKKVFNVIINPIVLKHWYIGDGNVKKNKDSKNKGTEITCKWYCPNIESQLINIFGEGCKYHQSSQKYYIPIKYRNMFIEYIGKNEVECYNYKFIKN